MSGDILDDLFTACAWAAYLEQAHLEQGWPDCEATRRLAYRLYEEELRAKNASVDTSPDNAVVVKEKAAGSTTP